MNQNVRFDDAVPDYEYEVPSQPDSTYNLCDNNDTQLQNFFMRPIKVGSFDWLVGDALYLPLDPWSVFFNDSRVSNRISNYNLMRCKLKVKMVINGNGFYYGRAIASYNPNFLEDTVTKFREFIPQDMIAASQRPHVYLDPTMSQGGTMTLPMFFNKNTFKLPDATYTGMGELIIKSLNTLRHANGGTKPVSVTVFVWAEDVVLSTPTSKNASGVVPQAGPMGGGDEYGQGIVSRPAAIFARAAGALSGIPYIGAYAKATQMVASGIASAALVFGYSRPNIVSDPIINRPTYLGNMANTNAPDTATKLTLDAKQELTIDTRTFGLDGSDELNLRSIAVRESYLTQFSWGVAAASGSSLFGARVTPSIWDIYTAGPFNEIHMPACCYAVQPFRNWRGGMRYRFQIVASSFHRGRLKFVYDPHSFQNSNNVDFNTNYTYIVDIAKERDFTLDVGWGQDVPWLNTGAVNNAFTLFQDDAHTSYMPTTNGAIAVFVVNELTTPSDLFNDVSINVFVSACDDFEVANPNENSIEFLSWQIPPPLALTANASLDEQAVLKETERKSRTTIYESQSGAMSDPMLTEQESAPVQESSVALNDNILDTADHSMDVFFGDPITSFRQILKRYNYSTSWYPQIQAYATNKWVLPNMPIYRGYLPSGIHTDVAANAYNYTNMTMLNYVVPAYGAYRGGIRWKYHCCQNYGAVPGAAKGNMTVERESLDTSGYSSSYNITPDGTTTVSDRSHNQITYRNTLLNGGQTTVLDQNPVLEVEIPFQENFRFFYGKNIDVTTNSLYNAFHSLLADFGNSLYNGRVDAYCAAGEDFTCGMFLGCPVAYSYLDPNPAI